MHKDDVLHHVYSSDAIVCLFTCNRESKKLDLICKLCSGA